MHLFELIIATAFVQIQAEIAEVQHVQPGATVTLGCNVKCFYNMAWFRVNPHGPPTLVVFVNLRKGQVDYDYQTDSRFTVEFVHHSFTITNISESDLGMYFCMGYLNSELLIGPGILLQGPFHFGFYHWYCLAVGCGLLFMVVRVCVVHWKTKEHQKIPPSEEQEDQNNSMQFHKSTF